MKRSWRNVAIGCIPFLSAAIIVYLMEDNIMAYAMVKKPDGSISKEWFPLVWGVLSMLVGLAAIRINKSRCSNRKEIGKMYGLQLFIQYLWVLIFFREHQYLLSLMVLMVLQIFIFLLFSAYLQVEKRSGYLVFPCFLWGCYVLYLNMGIWIMNM